MLASLLLALSLPGQAGAYYYIDAGTRGMARGGAYVAGNKDLTAQYYNPAALINLESGQIMLNFSLVDQRAAFTRMDLDESGEVTEKYDKVDNISPPMKIPSFGVAHHFGLPNTMFALGLHPPYAPDKEYTAKSAQRYTLIDTRTTQFYAGLSVAHQPLSWLTIGASILWNMTAANQELAINVCNANGDGTTAACENGDQNVTDLIINMKMKDPGKLTGNIGVLIEPIPEVSIGLSVMPPIDVEGTGTLSAEFSEDHWLTEQNWLETSKTKDDKITVSMSMPLVIRSGVAYRPSDKWEIEFATVYERWRNTKETLITDVNAPLILDKGKVEAVNSMPNTTTPIAAEVPITGPVKIPQKFRDSISYRLRAEWEPMDWLSLRTGMYYERSAIPNKNMGVALMDGNKVGYGLGASYHLKKMFSFDLAWSQSFLGTRNIRNSELKQLQVPMDFTAALNGEPLSTEIGRGPVVGNGDISATISMISAGVTYHFGKPTQRTHRTGNMSK